MFFNYLFHTPGEKLIGSVHLCPGVDCAEAAENTYTGVTNFSPGRRGCGVPVPTVTLQSARGHWLLLRGAKQGKRWLSERERERGKTPNKRGWNGVISFFLCNLQHTAKPHCRMTGGQKPFSAVTHYIAPANNGSYLLMTFRDSHACAALFAGQGKTSLSTYQAYGYKMLVAVLLALSIWLAWFISVETEDSVSSCWVLPW